MTTLKEWVGFEPLLINNCMTLDHHAFCCIYQPGVVPGKLVDVCIENVYFRICTYRREGGKEEFI